MFTSASGSMPDSMSGILELMVQGFMGPVLLIVGIAVVFALMRWLPGLARAVRFVLSVFPAILLWSIGVIATALWWPVSIATNFVLRFLPLDRFMSGLLALPARLSSDPMIAGRREAVARATWPEHVFPDLYRPVPLDVVRPPFEDGRLIGNVPLTHLADRHLTDTAYRSAIRAGFSAGLLFFLLIAVVLVLKTAFDLFAVVPALTGGARPIIEQWPGAPPIRVSVWSVIAANAGPAFGHLFGNLGRLIVYLPAAALIAVGTAIIVTLLLLSAWMREQAAPYELQTKDAAVRWARRIEGRRIVQETYRRQVEHATGHLAAASTFSVGSATGTLRARGDLSAPVSGQPLQLDSESLFQHTLVFGGTGEGKTSALLKPLMRKVLADRKFGAFVVDAKGVLWRDALQVARDLGRQDDVVLIGLGEGSVGVNLTAGLTPSQVSAVLRTVLAQVSGGSRGDEFWPDMAATVLRHMLTLGAGYARTPRGAEADEPHVDSLWWAYQALLNSHFADEAAAAIRLELDRLNMEFEHAHADPDADEAQAARLVEAIKSLANPELSASLDYVEHTWRRMAEETRTGIIANATRLLDGFGGATALRERFVSGRRAGVADADAALNGKIVLVTLSSVEDGLAARLVMVLMKTALYRAARRREVRFREEGRSVGEQPCLVVMDEVQELATVDPASGLSDATFWNVARSTGMAGLFATQTVAALNQAMGEAAADNFIQQARSKVFFRTEEQDTVEFACWCAGEYERNRTFDEGQRESIEYRELIDNWTPLAPVDETASVDAGPRAFFGAARALLNPERTQLRAAVARPAYAPDLRFIPAAGKDVNDGTIMAARGAAHWRAEDKNREYRSEGNEIQAALSSSDLMHMGRWHAFAQIQRAGALRQDIITVTHDFG